MVLNFDIYLNKTIGGLAGKFKDNEKSEHVAHQLYLIALCLILCKVQSNLIKYRSIFRKQ